MMRANRGITLSFRFLYFALLAFVPASQTAAQDGGVRVILPLQLNAKPTDEFERIETDRNEPVDYSAICDRIAASADEFDLPRPFLARLVWRESRFEPDTVARTGEQGIARFPPGLAFRRGLRDAFDPQEAIPALAAYLAELRDRFGNIGLAAAAWDVGEEDLAAWLEKGGYLAISTEDYLLAVLGDVPGAFREPNAVISVTPLRDDMPFAEACRAASDLRDAILLDDADRPAWGAQLAGHFDRAIAMRQWELLKQRHPALLGDIEPAVFAARTHLGRNRTSVVQVGAESRAEAQAFCAKMRAEGGACLVKRN